MHAMIDRLDGQASEAAADRAGGLRDCVLGLTSALRTEVDQRGDAAALDRLRRIGREIAAAGSHADLAPLVRCAEGLCELTLGAWESTAPIDGLLHAVGRIERVLDGCLEGMEAGRLGQLCDAAAAREIGLGADEDGEVIDLALDAALPDRAPGEDVRATRRAPHEQELFDAFAAEALDVLDHCEGHVLRAELEPGGANGLDNVSLDLATIRDAGVAVGLLDLDAPAGAATVDTLLECIDTTRQRIEDAWSDSNAAAIDPATLLPIDEIVLRLRRTARDVARRQGGMIRIDTEGCDLRLTAALAERIYEPLTEMIAGAASQVAPGAVGTLQLRIARDQGTLSLAIDDGAGELDDDADGVERPEALHWIDARRPAADDEGARLIYRPGSVNVVQVMTG